MVKALIRSNVHGIAGKILKNMVPLIKILILAICGPENGYNVREKPVEP